MVGSVNMDLVVLVERLPRPGETLIGSDYATHPGGKGANQAVAAARLGAAVRFVGRLGGDTFGAELNGALVSEGVDIAPLRMKDSPSGVAFIQVDAKGQNSIVVAPGANALLSEEDLSEEDWRGAKVVMLQLEVPLPTVLAAAGTARRVGAEVLLNLAPALRLEADQLADVSLLLVNEHEAALLLGIGADLVASAPERAAKRLVEAVPAAVITLGGSGAAWAVRDRAKATRAPGFGAAILEGSAPGHGPRSGLEPAYRVEVVDTTAAGDAFAGALAVYLASHGQGGRAGEVPDGDGAGYEVSHDRAETLAAAVRFANAAGALAASRRGAQPSLPSLAEVGELLRSRV